MDEPCELSLVEAAAEIRSGRLRPSELLESCLRRIADREPTVRAWALVDADGARAAAAALDGRPATGALHGIPVGIKDIVDVEGLPTRCGSALTSARPVEADAWVVRRLREAGAVVVGKTVTTEFAYFDPPVTRNPLDPDRTPGGSSSGSAAAVADFMVPLAVGTQTAGSTARPASFCGVAGLVLTPGRYPNEGVAALSPSLDTLGLLARRVDDLSVAAEAVTGVQHAASLQQPPHLLLCSGESFGELTSDMRSALGAAVDTLGAHGASVRALPVTPAMAGLPRAHATVMAAEAARSLAREAATGGLSPALRQLLDDGARIETTDYEAALAQAAEQRTAVEAALAGHAGILAPAAPGCAPTGRATGDPAFSRPWHVMGLPAVAVAGMRAPDGLPLGLQLIGRPGHEPELLETAVWIEQRLRERARLS